MDGGIWPAVDVGAIRDRLGVELIFVGLELRRGMRLVLPSANEDD